MEKSPYYLLQKLLLFIKLFFKQKYTKHKKYTTKVIGNKVSFVSILWQMFQGCIAMKSYFFKRLLSSVFAKCTKWFFNNAVKFKNYFPHWKIFFTRKVWPNFLWGKKWFQIPFFKSTFILPPWNFSIQSSSVLAKHRFMHRFLEA